MKKTKLIPADPKQCQAIKREYSPFMFGLPEMKRCPNKPKWIAKEIKATNEDGMKGEMSLCPECRIAFISRCDCSNIHMERIKEKPCQRKRHLMLCKRSV